MGSFIVGCSGSGAVHNCRMLGGHTGGGFMLASPVSKRRRLVWSSSPEPEGPAVPAASSVRTRPDPALLEGDGDVVSDSCCGSEAEDGTASEGTAALPEFCENCSESVCEHCLHSDRRCLCDSAPSPTPSTADEVARTGCCLDCIVDLCETSVSETESETESDSDADSDSAL